MFVKTHWILRTLKSGSLYSGLFVKVTSGPTSKHADILLPIMLVNYRPVTCFRHARIRHVITKRIARRHYEELI